jgi:hypothetical protein
VAVEGTGDPTELTLVYWGLDAEAGEHCTARVEVESEVAADGVLEAEIILYPVEASRDWGDCPRTEQRLALHLDEPLGDAPLRHQFGDLAVRANASGVYEPIAETTPCGRVDCSIPSPDPAPCDGDAVREAFATEVDGGIRTEGEPRCDGSFLVVDMDIGSSGCPPTEGEESPCKRVKRAYFVANAGHWSIVTYGTDVTCEEVRYDTGIRFPTEVC